MTSLLEGAKRLVSRSPDTSSRIEGLEAAITASRGRLPDELLDASQQTLDRVSSRLWLSADHTVVAIAGATGSGKSSTFNALTGLELSAVGVRRPTTSWATA
ncbi:MAG: ABC transporter, partial [Nocardioides sp.]